MGSIHVVRQDMECFLDRTEAGRFLALELAHYQGAGTVVLGIPRGGVVVAGALAGALGAALDVMFAHKLRSPGNPEMAMGAVAEGGDMILEESVSALVSAEYLAREKEAQLELMASRSKRYRKIRPKIPLQGKVTIVTDDGVAMGLTMEVSLQTARKEHPKKLVAAIPVGPELVVRRIARLADETICLGVPKDFFAVGQFYLDFRPVDDQDVTHLLKA